MLALPSFKRRESTKDAVRRRMGLATKQDKRQAVSQAEHILRRAMG